MATRSQTQRSLLFAFIGSILLCGLVGIYCLLLGRWGGFEGRIMGTTASVGAAAILGLVSVIPWEQRRWHPIGPFASWAVLIALGLVVLAIWFEPPDETFLKIMFSCCIFAVALPHIGLMSLARLRKQYERVRLVTAVVIAALAVQIILSIWAEVDEEAWYRAMGILGIVVVCGTIAVPVLHRVSGISAREAIETVELMLTLTCPRCAVSQTLPVGRSACSSCGLKFVIEIEEEHCAVCGYSLYRLESAACPECGTPIARDGAHAAPAASSGSADRGTTSKERPSTEI